MIISHEHQFIFMHNQKTAGSTITGALNPHLGPCDIQTMGWAETLRSGGSLNRRAKFILLAHAPRLFGTSMKHAIKKKKRPFWVNLAGVNRTLKHVYKQETGFSNVSHPTAAEVKRYDEEAWRNYFKFAVVRNPWDHAVSYYHWKMHENEVSSISFKEYLKRVSNWDRPDPEGIRPPRKSAWDMLAIGDEIALDYVARFENLAEDMNTIAGRIGIPIDMGNKTKSNIRSKNKSFAAYYDDESIELVRRIYAKEIDCFDYEPPF